MNPHRGGFAAAVIPAERRARLRGRPSGLKGRCRDRYATGHGPPLTPEPLRPLTAQRHGQAQSPCPPDRHGARLSSRPNPYKRSLYRFTRSPKAV
jgi:hypothetical protein